MTRRARKPGSGRALAIAAVATLAAMGIQQAIRNAWQVRSLPERAMETLLVFIPLDLFERGLQRFGANAKDIALVGTYVGMAAVLLVAGWWTVRRFATNAWLCLALGGLLWLATMLVALPLTGAGAFGSGLLSNPLLVDAAFGCVFAAYSGVLAVGTLLLNWQPGAQRVGTANLERRSVLAGLGSTFAALVAFGVARSAASAPAQSSLPLAAAPTAIVPTATPAP